MMSATSAPNTRNSPIRVHSTVVNTSVRRTSENHRKSVHALTSQPRNMNSTIAPGAADLLRDPADRPDVALLVDRAGARDRQPAGEVLRLDLVDDPEREHQPRARAAHVVQGNRDLVRARLVLVDLHADPR